MIGKSCGPTTNIKDATQVQAESGNFIKQGLAKASNGRGLLVAKSARLPAILVGGKRCKLESVEEMLHTKNKIGVDNGSVIGTTVATY
jgi:hypothetical protein